MAVSPVRGVDTLDRAFSMARASTQRNLPRLFRAKAEPVRRSAELNARAIGAGVPWSRMRIGASRRAVWIAPVERGTRIVPRKRPRFATRLKTLAMEPALEANRALIENEVDDLLARIERQFNRG